MPTDSLVGTVGRGDQRGGPTDSLVSSLYDAEVRVTTCRLMTRVHPPLDRKHCYLEVNPGSSGQDQHLMPAMMCFGLSQHPALEGSHPPLFHCIHLVIVTRPSSPLFFPSREEDLGTRLLKGILK